MFLPPYSPDYNPIEQAFSSIKAWFWHTSTTGLSAIREACQNIMPEMAQGWFRALGYM
jgi:transposase